MQYSIDIEQIKQYDSIFGREKMLKLFNDYQNKLETDFKNTKIAISEGNFKDLRIIFHSLASASLVFGMTNSAKTCKNIEEAILQNSSMQKLDLDINESYQLLEKEKQEVMYFLENENE